MAQPKIKFVQLEIEPFFCDLLEMSPLERSCYITLILKLYKEGGVWLCDSCAMAGVCAMPELEFGKVWTRLRRKFSQKNHRLRHKRVTQELEKARGAMQAHREKGLRGADARWHSQCLSNAQAMPNKNKNKNKNKNNTYSPNSDEFRLAHLLFSTIQKRKPDFKEPNIQVWAKHINRMIRLDNRTPEQIEKVIRWCQQDDFWQNNILSTEKLRKQFDQMELKMPKKPKPRTPEKPLPCLVCHKPSAVSLEGRDGKPVPLCGACISGWERAGGKGKRWAGYSLAEIEKLVLEGKAQK